VQFGEQKYNSVTIGLQTIALLFSIESVIVQVL